MEFNTDDLIKIKEELQANYNPVVQWKRSDMAKLKIFEFDLLDTTNKRYLFQGREVLLTQRQRDRWAEAGIDLKEITS